MTSGKLPPLDPVIHSQVRLAVISILASAERADFNFLKNAAETTDGNLSTHLARLEEAGYISIEKTFRGKRPLTTCFLTEKGRAAFRDYLEALESYFPGPRNRDSESA